MSANTNDRHIPVRNGEVYCSPDCNCGCLYADFVKAKRAATLTARRLGPGWEPLVFESGGWYYVVTNGPVELERFDSDQTWNATYSLGGIYLSGEGKTAKRALATLKAHMRQAMCEIGRTLTNCCK